jgi:DNA polymerase-3 subunit gamma/tau
MSDQYIVSALKYRPQHFNTVVGQSHITTTLKNAIRNNQLAHSFLFCGPRGVGKTTCARILAKTINCTNRTEDAEACDVCPSCVSFRDNTSFNVHELDAASNNSVDDIRELIEQVRIVPQGGAKYKVYIIDEVHMLSNSAFNAFLKTLEEPPSYAIFILATTEKHKILPTILSRCQIFDFNRITTADTLNHLSEICDKEHIVFEKEALHLIAQKSEGCMRDALSIMDKIASFTNDQITYTNTVEHLNILDYDYFFKVIDTLMLQDLSGIMLIYDEIIRKGFEGDMFLNGLTEHLRNLLFSRDPRVVHLLDFPEAIQARYFQQATQVSQAYIINALSVVNQSEQHYKMARNKRLHVELALVKLNYLQNAIQLLSDEQSGTVKKKLLTQEVFPLKAPIIRSIPIKPKVSIEPSVTPPPIKQTSEKITQPITSASAPPTTTAPANTASYGVTLGGLKGLKNLVRDKVLNQQQQEVIVIDSDQLRIAWEKIALQLTAEKIIYRNAIMQTLLSFEDHVITLTADPVALDYLKGQRLILLDFFKNYFRNQEVNILFALKPEEMQNPADRVLSTREIFDKMAAKNPALRKLRDGLNMDFDL